MYPDKVQYILLLSKFTQNCIILYSYWQENCKTELFNPWQGDFFWTIRPQTGGIFSELFDPDRGDFSELFDPWQVGFFLNYSTPDRRDFLLTIWPQTGGIFSELFDPDSGDFFWTIWPLTGGIFLNYSIPDKGDFSFNPATMKLGRKELSFCHKLRFSKPYIFLTWSCKPLSFQIYVLCSNLRSTKKGYKDIGIRKSEFVATTQFLSNKMIILFSKSSYWNETFLIVFWWFFKSQIKCNVTKIKCILEIKMHLLQKRQYVFAFQLHLELHR